MEFGVQLARLREQAGISQVELARRAGVTQPYISMLEGGRQCHISVKVAGKIAAGLDVPVQTLTATLVEAVPDLPLGGNSEMVSPAQLKVEQLGPRVYEMRHECYTSMATLAKESGVSETTIRRIEHGTVASVRRETLQKLALALGLTVDQLASGWKPQHCLAVALGERVHRLRVDRGLSLEDLARKARLPIWYLQRLEEGETALVAEGSVMKFATALNVTSDALLDGIRNVEEWEPAPWDLEEAGHDAAWEAAPPYPLHEIRQKPLDRFLPLTVMALERLLEQSVVGPDGRILDIDYSLLGQIDRWISVDLASLRINPGRREGVGGAIGEGRQGRPASRGSVNLP